MVEAFIKRESLEKCIKFSYLKDDFCSQRQENYTVG